MLNHVIFSKDNAAELIIILIGLAMTALLLMTPYGGGIPLTVALSLPVCMSSCMLISLGLKVTGKVNLSRYVNQFFALFGTVFFAVIVYFNKELPMVLAPGFALVIVFFERSRFGLGLVLLIGIYLSFITYVTPGIDLAVTVRALGSYFAVILLIGHLVRLQENEANIRRSLEETNYQLNRAVTELEANQQKLESEKAKAESSNKAKSIFLSNMSHEIRTPLNAIIGLLYLAENEKDKEQILGRISEIKNPSKILLSLINDILDVSKIEAGELSLESRPFHIYALIDQIGSAASSISANKNVQINIYIHELAQQVFIGDELRISQIGLNLVSNAVKFTEEGQVSIALSCSEKGPLTIQVSDTGVGMSDLAKKNILHPFSQADDSISRRFGGTGLGLTIVKSLVDMMQGNLSIESKENEGTNITVELPLLPAHRDLYYHEEVAGKIVGANILLIESRSSGELQSYLEHLLAPTQSKLNTSPFDNAISKIMDSRDRNEPYQLVMLVNSVASELEDLIHSVARKSSTQEAIIVFDSCSSNDLKNVVLHQSSVKRLETPITPSDFYKTIYSSLAQIEDSSYTSRQSSEPLQDCLSGVRILSVEDNRVNQMILTSILKKFGAEVAEAEHGQVAVETLESHVKEFDIVVMDLQMPVMDGLTATQLIREQHSQEVLPIIALTANAMKKEKDKCFAAGMNDYLTKPIDPDVLLTVLLKWCKGKTLTEFQ